MTPHDLCLPLILLEDISRIVPPLLKCVLSHIKWPKTWHPTFTLPCSSHLFIALLHQVPTQLLFLFQVLILCFRFSILSPRFPTLKFHCPAVTSALPQPLNHIFLSILSLLYYYKMSCISFPKHCFLRNYFMLLQLKNRVFSSKSCNF